MLRRAKAVLVKPIAIVGHIYSAGHAEREHAQQMMAQSGVVKPGRWPMQLTAIQVAHLVLFAAVVAFNALSAAPSKPFGGQTNSRLRDVLHCTPASVLDALAARCQDG
jgi:hypothetical protein